MSSAPEPGRLNIRTRIALTVIVLVGFALSLVGVTLNTVERATTESQVLADLWRVVDEFEVLATEGVDPRTGRQFDNPSRLLEVALQRAALKPTEGQLGLVTGQAPWVAAEGVQLRPEKDPALMAHLTPLARLADITAGEFTSDQARYRYVVVPVIFEASQDRGSLIRVVDMGAEMEVVNQLMRIYVLVAFGSMLLVAAFT